MTIASRRRVSQSDSVNILSYHSSYRLPTSRDRGVHCFSDIAAETACTRLDCHQPIQIGRPTRHGIPVCTTILLSHEGAPRARVSSRRPTGLSYQKTRLFFDYLPISRQLSYRSDGPVAVQTSHRYSQSPSLNIAAAPAKGPHYIHRRFC